MAEAKLARPKTENEAVVDRAKDFWSRYGKIISIVVGGVILVVGGFLIYKNLFVGPKEKKGADAIVKVQTLYNDSLYNPATGELQPKFIDQIIAESENVIRQHGGTKSGNLARFYAGSAYLRKGIFDKAVSHLKEFDGEDAPQIQARAYKLLADAYAEQNKGKEAVDNYKKAAQFEDDPAAASEALFYAGYLNHKVVKDEKAATELYKELLTKYRQSPEAGRWVGEAEKYLASLGVYNVD